MRTRHTPLEGTAVPDKHWRQAESRGERSLLIREALFRAAAEVVGETGYQGASVALITQRAEVAQGTFYNHFTNRQDILDQLLPAIGQEMLDYVRECAKKGNTASEKEELSLVGFFDFLKLNPHFFRILNEAESFAPKAYRAHLDLVSKGYVAFLARSREHGELGHFDDQELEVVAFILMAARSYLAWRYLYGAEQHDTLPRWVIDAYMKFVRNGFSSLKPAA